MGRHRVLAEVPEGLSLPERLAFAQHIEALGFDGVTQGEITDPDAFVVLALMAQRTERLTLETVIVQLGVRTAPSIAASAATVQNASGGRFRLGLGVSTEAIVPGWHGRQWESPLTTAKESIEVIRALLAGEKSRYHGREVQSTGFQIQDVPQTSVPLHLAGLNQVMVRTAAEVADGVWLTYIPRHRASAVAGMIDAAAYKDEMNAALEAFERRDRPAVMRARGEQLARIRPGSGGSDRRTDRCDRHHRDRDPGFRTPSRSTSSQASMRSPLLH